MNDPQKKANMTHAGQVISTAILAAMKQVAADTGAIEVHMKAEMGMQSSTGLNAGGVMIALVYPPEQAAQPADPRAATNLVEDLLRRLKSSRGN